VKKIRPEKRPRALSEWRSALLILCEQSDLSINLHKLYQELATRRTLGFITDPENIVQFLIEKDYIDYDPKTNIVRLKPQNIIKESIDILRLPL
jgi:hypothetical protein